MRATAGELQTTQAEHVRRQFEEIYRQTPHLYCAPGRVNLIGEHTDYNNGFVMPAAINLNCTVAIAPRQDRILAVHSNDFPSEAVTISLDDLAPQARWSDYVHGVASMLEKSEFRLGGANVLVSSEVPIGAGLSSSAALEVAVGFALLDLNGFVVDRKLLASICQRAENEFVGARCGIMDQFIGCHGEKGHCLLLDCRSLQYRLLPIAEGVRLVVCNTMVKHEIAAGEYNVRRAQCEEGVRILSQKLSGISSLRDVSSEDFERHCGLLSPLLQKRCRHAIRENDRVLTAGEALQRGSLNDFGRLMSESHESLRDDYEVSCPELDLMVELAVQAEGTFGARMTGGGFGGCTINLVATEAVPAFTERVSVEYRRRTGLNPTIYAVTASQGARRCGESPKEILS
jgi:galactokinase